jgi:hypothetical protein
MARDVAYARMGTGEPWREASATFGHHDNQRTQQLPESIVKHRAAGSQA